MRFYVYRHGYNTANNPSRNGGPATIKVAEVEATDEATACDIARLAITVYNNQYVYAKPADEVDAVEQSNSSAIKAIYSM